MNISKKYIYYHGYKCTLLKPVKDLKEGTKVCAMKLPHNGNIDHWYLLIHNTAGDVLNNDAKMDIDFEIDIVDETIDVMKKPDDEEKLDKKKKRKWKK